MKRILFKLPLLFSFFFIATPVSAQNNFDKTLTRPPKDTNDVKQLIGFAGEYLFSNPDSSILIAKEALSLSRQLKFKRGEVSALIMLGEDYRTVGDFPQALEALFKALELGRELDDQLIEANSLDFIGIAYVNIGEPRQGLNYLLQAKELNEKRSLTDMNSFRLTNIGFAYEKLDMPDSALFFHEQAYQLWTTIKSEQIRHGPLHSLILRQLGNVHYRLRNYDKALSCYREVISNNDLLNTSNAQFHVAEYFFNIKHNIDSSYYYALLAFKNAQRSFQKTFILDASRILAKLHKARNRFDSAYYYHEIALAINDSLFGPEKIHKLQLLAINEQQRQQEIRQEKESLKNRIRIYILFAAVGVFLLLAIIFYRNNRQKQKTNKVLEDTLGNLRSTQSQLVQAEKMASLGELTAGIAHEIQNPLNFVNNFSEVNKELIDEAKEEMDKGNTSDVHTILDNIRDNELKINQHGKRADAIVKNMLQHSRTNSGKKEPTDINALAEEYLRLSYHGFRAKDKAFNANFKTDFDESIGKINLVPQDIGRVVLNLINNAFYAVNEKQKQSTNGYEPLVTVITKKENARPDDPLGRGKVEIKVQDNGNGIPEKVLAKIFQPFFTTKPTGQGTGLGLSLAYDIVKAHGGEIKVKTKEREATEFIIQLPTI